MRYNPVIATVTIAVGALALIGAIIWQVIHDKAVDVYIGTLVGTLFGAFLNTPASATDRRGDEGRADVVTILLVVVLALAALALGSYLFDYRG